MNAYINDFDFAEPDLPAGSRFTVYDSATELDSDRFQDEFSTFEFEAMTEVPSALTAFVSHQHTFGL
jgi:hypothetical protein